MVNVPPVRIGFKNKHVTFATGIEGQESPEAWLRIALGPLVAHTPDPTRGAKHELRVSRFLPNGAAWAMADHEHAADLVEREFLFVLKLKVYVVIRAEE
jgi:hypothetical protein